MTRWVVKYLNYKDHPAIVRVWAESREAAKQRVVDAKIAVKVYGAEQERR